MGTRHSSMRRLERWSLCSYSLVTDCESIVGFTVSIYWSRGEGRNLPSNVSNRDSHREVREDWWFFSESIKTALSSCDHRAFPLQLGSSLLAP